MPILTPHFLTTDVRRSCNARLGSDSNLFASRERSSRTPRYASRDWNHFVLGSTFGRMWEVTGFQAVRHRATRFMLSNRPLPPRMKPDRSFILPTFLPDGRICGKQRLESSLHPYAICTSELNKEQLRKATAKGSAKQLCMLE
eukprot:3915864-Pleurochrysis_carterae.AAC.1